MTKQGVRKGCTPGAPRCCLRAKHWGLQQEPQQPWRRTTHPSVADAAKRWARQGCSRAAQQSKPLHHPPGWRPGSPSGRRKAAAGAAETAETAVRKQSTHPAGGQGALAGGGEAARDLGGLQPRRLHCFDLRRRTGKTDRPAQSAVAPATQRQPANSDVVHQPWASDRQLAATWCTRPLPAALAKRRQAHLRNHVLHLAALGGRRPVVQPPIVLLYQVSPGVAQPLHVSRHVVVSHPATGEWQTHQNALSGLHTSVSLLVREMSHTADTPHSGAERQQRTQTKLTNSHSHRGQAKDDVQ